MTGNVSTVDGMGFEEVNQSSFTEMISGNNLYGNNLWISDMAEINTVSGLIVVAGTISGGSIRDSDGTIRPIAIENATEIYPNGGLRLKAGSVKIGDDSSGLIAFKTNFANANWYMTLTARDWTLPIASNTSGTGFSVSGLRRESGCWAYGPSGTVADWMAIGI